MAVGAFLSFEFGISGECNTTEVKQPESCPVECEDRTLLVWYRFLTHLAREGRMTVTIGRREVLAALGGAAAWPLTARAQQAERPPTIGFLGAGTLSTYSPWAAAFMQRLRELGWIEGRNIAIEYRWADGRNERYSEIATEFTRLKVDVIVTTGTGAVIAAKQTTASIPIVFTSTGDPVATGLVASLAQPGGNVTGLSNQLPDATGK